MKRGILLLCFILSLICRVETVHGEEVQESKIYGEFEYSYDNEKDCIWILKYRGNQQEVVVPAFIDGKEVRYLHHIFRGNKTIKRVQLPDTLVAMSSFNGCTALEEINIPNNVKWIPQYTFYGCKSLKHVQLPTQLYSIDQYAFAGCESLTEMIMPNTINSLGKNAFANCTNLQKVTLSKKLEYIPQRAFYHCKKLKQITIPKGIEQICEEAFAGCTSMEKVKFPSTLQYIEAYAFEGCGMRELVIPKEGPSLHEGCFSYCRKLKKIVIKSKSLSICNLVFYNIHKKAVFDVPNSCIRKYKKWLTATGSFKSKTMKIK